MFRLTCGVGLLCERDLDQGSLAVALGGSCCEPVVVFSWLDLCGGFRCESFHAFDGSATRYEPPIIITPLWFTVRKVRACRYR